MNLREPWRLGGVQFDFARLETEPLNLFVRQNSFEPDDFICQGAVVEHLKLRLFVICRPWRTAAAVRSRGLEQRSASPLVA